VHALQQGAQQSAVARTYVATAPRWAAAGVHLHTWAGDGRRWWWRRGGTVAAHSARYPHRVLIVYIPAMTMMHASSAPSAGCVPVAHQLYHRTTTSTLACRAWVCVRTCAGVLLCIQELAVRCVTTGRRRQRVTHAQHADPTGFWMATPQGGRKYAKSNPAHLRRCGMRCLNLCAARVARRVAAPDASGAPCREQGGDGGGLSSSAV